MRASRGWLDNLKLHLIGQRRHPGRIVAPLRIVSSIDRGWRRGSAETWSSFSRTSAGNRQPDARRLSRSWSAVGAPAMALVTKFWSSTHRRATCAGERPNPSPPPAVSPGSRRGSGPSSELEKPSPRRNERRPLPQEALQLDQRVILQAALDLWLADYSQRRTHQGRYCFGKTPMQTSLDASQLAHDKQIGGDRHHQQAA
jgi:hypothetical protein